MGIAQDEIIKEAYPIMQGADLSMRLKTFVVNVHRTAEAYGIAIGECLETARIDPRFLTYDHRNFVKNATEAYGMKNLGRIRKAVLRHPSFGRRDHIRFLEELQKVYGSDNTVSIINAVLSYPQFADINHGRAVADAKEAYGEENAERIKKAFLMQPSLAPKDHARIIREKSRVSKLCNLGFSREEIVNFILDRPAMAGCSYHRDIAMIDVFRQIGGKNLTNAERLRIAANRFSLSPYVPGTDRERISSFAETYDGERSGVERKRLYQLEEFEEPPFMTKVLASLENPRKTRRQMLAKVHN